MARRFIWRIVTEGPGHRRALCFSGDGETTAAKGLLAARIANGETELSTMVADIRPERSPRGFLGRLKGQDCASIRSSS